MKVAAENINVSECLTVGEFVKALREKTGNANISSSTIHYHLENTDNLDFVEFCGLKLIVQNEKAKSFSPGSYYGNNRTMKKIQL